MCFVSVVFIQLLDENVFQGEILYSKNVKSDNFKNTYSLHRLRPKEHLIVFHSNVPSLERLIILIEYSFWQSSVKDHLESFQMKSFIHNNATYMGKQCSVQFCFLMCHQKKRWMCRKINHCWRVSFCICFVA